MTTTSWSELQESLGEASAEIARFVAAGIVPTPRGAISLVDVRDVAAIHRLLLEPGDRPSRVMCGGTHLTLPEFGEELAVLTGRRFRVLPVHPRALVVAGRIADRVASVLPVELPLTEEAMAVPTSWPGTEDNAPGELGIQCARRSPHPFAPGSTQVW